LDGIAGVGSLEGSALASDSEAGDGEADGEGEGEGLGVGVDLSDSVSEGVSADSTLGPSSFGVSDGVAFVLDFSSSDKVGDGDGEDGASTLIASKLHSAASISPFEAHAGIVVPSGGGFGNSTLRAAPQFVAHSLNG
jgi:hypothetical protein